MTAVAFEALFAQALMEQGEAESRPPQSLGEFTSALDPSNVQTPALDLLDEKLAAVASSQVSRLIWSMSPQEGKSQRVSRRFPTWLLKRNPELRIAIASYELSTARRWGRQIRNDLAEHPELGLTVRGDTSAAHEWQLEGHQGGVYSVGIGGPLTGRPVDVLLIDDPLKDRAQADSEVRREACWDWWTNVARTRLSPGAPVVIIMCMTGDTPVLMADGQEKPLRDVRPGDSVATFEAGALTTSTVRNWANQGPDAIYAIKMKSGRTVRANARHPFLTIDNGEHSWQRTDSLKPGSVIQTVIGGSTEALPARSTDAKLAQSARACALPTTTSSGGPAERGRRLSMLKVAEPPTSSTDTDSPSASMMRCWTVRTDGAPSAASTPPTETPGLIGTESCASITTTTPDVSEGCSATIATLPLATESQRPFSAPPLTTWTPEPDEVVEVVACGTEDVFDIQVDRTENFIANGLVSHNTRWHEDDLAGRLIEGGGWDVVNIPAQAEGDDDLLGREPGEYLQSTRGRTAEEWEDIKRDVGPRVWGALYQGTPSPADGDMLKRGWWKHYVAPQAVEQDDGTMLTSGFDKVIQSWDFTFKDTKKADFVVGTVWGQRGADVYLLDLVRSRMDFPATCRAVQATTVRWPQANAKLVEEKANGAAVIAQLKSTVGGIIAINPTESKEARVSAVSPYVESGNVYLPSVDRADPSFRPWVAGFVEECAAFPNGTHDDQVDSMSQALNRLLVSAKRSRVRWM